MRSLRKTEMLCRQRQTLPLGAVGLAVAVQLLIPYPLAYSLTVIEHPKVKWL
jgi:hypothetical protein